MTMGYHLPVAILLAVAFVPVGCAPATQASLGAQGSLVVDEGHRRIPLSVLVTGREDGPRRADFVQFLEQHVERVGVASYTNFQASDADGWDVVVFDAEVRPTPERIGLPPVPTLPDDFRRASVLMQGAGVNAVSRLNPKIDWL